MSVDLREVQEFLSVLSQSGLVCSETPLGADSSCPGWRCSPSPRSRASVLNKGFHVTSHSADSGPRATVKAGEEGG